MTSKRLHFIDFETHRFEPYLQCPPIVCMSWKSEGGGDAKLALWCDARAVIAEMLMQAIHGNAVIAAHNASYDMSCIVANDEELAPLVWRAYAADGIECTKAREKLLDIHDGVFKQGRKNYSPYSLDEIVQRRYDDKLDKGGDSWRTNYKKLDGVPISEWPKRAVDYAIGDADWGYRLHVDQSRGAIKRRYGLPTQHLEARADCALKLTSAWGVTTDQKRAVALGVEIDARMLELEARLVDAGLYRLKNRTLTLFDDIRVPAIKSLAAVRAAVETTWPAGLGPIPRTPAKAIKTDKDTVELCNHPALAAMLEHGSLQKQGSTYVKALLQDVIHAYFNGLVSSGRTSCRAPNLQNQPRMPGIRECFVARPGRVLLACDFDSQEMRTLAQAQLSIVGTSRLASFYQKDVKFDPHQYFAKATGGARQHAKIANFGIPGGMGVRGLVRYAKGYGQTWTPEFAAQIKGQYFEWWPEMDDFFRFIRSVVGSASCGNLVIPQSGMVCGSVGYCDASNRLFQTLAAHASKDALFAVVRRCFDASMGSVLLGSRPWAFIHDEVIVEAPEFAIDDIAPEIERVMVEAMQPWVPDVPCSAGATPMRRWSKKAEVIRDARGRLVPWDEGMEVAA